MKFGSARGSVRKIIATDMPGLKRDAVKVVEFADSKSSAGVSDDAVRRGKGLSGLVGRVPTPLEEGG